MLENVLVLGIGSCHGTVFQEIQNFAKRFYACDAPANELAPVLLRNQLIHRFFPVDPSSPEDAYQQMTRHLSAEKIRPGVVFTCREEWLQLHSLAKAFGLPYLRQNEPLPPSCSGLLSPEHTTSFGEIYQIGHA